MTLEMTDREASYIQQADGSISGYLYKRSRDNRWQKRWFETNGVYLTYYKSKKADKLMAALSLPDVGEIKLIQPSENPEKLEGLFSLELNSRIYILRSKTHEEAEKWVQMLNKLQEEGRTAMKASKIISPLPSSAMGMISDDSSLRSAENSGGPIDRLRPDWIKSGKSCCGCC